jgi:hypothetical protein
MDTVTAFSPRRQDSPLTTAIADPSRTLAVTATYQLSEDGRKASLLAGGNGRALQQLTIQVPVNRLHLVNVDAHGIARLKLKPRYELNEVQRVVRIDEVPTYDAPPDLEDLFRDAARNHQLERTYRATREAAKHQRRDAGRERRAQVAQAFLSDPTQRAVAHPVPTPTQCVVATPQGRLFFDSTKHDGVAHDVPAEAYRRFRADLRTRREHGQQLRAAQLALHEEKKRFVAEWITAHGTPEHRARQAAEVLPITDGVEAIADYLFAPLNGHPRYLRDALSQLQALVHQAPGHADTVVKHKDLLVTTSELKQTTSAQWVVVNEFRALVPDATVTLQSQRIRWRRDGRVALPPACAVLVVQQFGPLTLRREYRAPSS